MECGASSPEHCRLQVDVPSQLTEQEPVQVISQVDPPVQLTLPLGPTVTVHSDPPLQSMLHDWPHSPEQVLSLEQSSEQLCSAHSPPPMSHSLPAGQMQEVPVHSGGLAPPPQPAAEKMRTTRERMIRIGRFYLDR